MKFSYVKLPAQIGKSIELPLIGVELSVGRYLCLVDSGAEFCYFHGKIGEMLGVTVKDGRPMESRGVTGDTFLAYFHKIPIKIGGWEYTIEVAFSYELGMPFGILGREGFFGLFYVCFDHTKREIELKAK